METEFVHPKLTWNRYLRSFAKKLMANEEWGIITTWPKGQWELYRLKATLSCLRGALSCLRDAADRRSRRPEGRIMLPKGRTMWPEGGIISYWPEGKVVIMTFLYIRADNA